MHASVSFNEDDNPNSNLWTRVTVTDSELVGPNFAVETDGRIRYTGSLKRRVIAEFVGTGQHDSGNDFFLAIAHNSEQLDSTAGSRIINAADQSPIIVSRIIDLDPQDTIELMVSTEVSGLVTTIGWLMVIG
jgi:hypothetical protein